MEKPATTRSGPNPLLGSACKRDNPCVVHSPARLLRKTRQLSKLYHNLHHPANIRSPLHASCFTYLSLFAAPIASQDPFAVTGRCPPEMRRAHAADACKCREESGEEYSDWCALQILWTLEEEHPVLPSWGAQWALFLTSTQVVLRGKEYNYVGMSLSQNCM